MRAAAAVAVLCLAAPAARAQVAVSTSIAAEDPAQRDIASRVVAKARAVWRVTDLPNSDCKPGEIDCLRRQAVEHGDTHVLVVGVAPLGVRDHVLVVQLFDVKSATPLFDQNAVQTGGDFDEKQVDKVGNDLVHVAGPPLRTTNLEPTPVAPAVRPVGALSVVGAGLVAVGATAALATVGVAVLYANAQDPLNAGNAAVVGAAVSGGLVSAGAVALFVDAL